MKIVAMGGGNGLSTLLKGLKGYVRDEISDDILLDIVFAKSSGERSLSLSELTAIVTVSDDGGSSGRLRRDLQVLPPGDIRNCMVALSEDEALLSRLFQFRFTGGKGLKGHSFGNLFLTALTGVTGDFQEAIKVSGEVLAIRGCIFPSTVSDVRLEAKMASGVVVRGETRISSARGRIDRVRLVPPTCRPLPQTLEAIRKANVITLGPGSLFTSLIPNLLVRGVARAIAESSATRIFICNLMTQPGETSEFTAADHIKAVYKHSGVPLFDYVLVNSAPVSPSAKKRYAVRSAKPVEIDMDELEKLGLRVMAVDLVSEDPPGSARRRTAQKKVRHSSERLAEMVMDIAAKDLDYKQRNEGEQGGGK